MGGKRREGGRRIESEVRFCVEVVVIIFYRLIFER